MSHFDWRRVICHTSVYLLIVWSHLSRHVVSMASGARLNPLLPRRRRAFDEVLPVAS